jgi:hypothetical protein
MDAEERELRDEIRMLTAQPRSADRTNRLKVARIKLKALDMRSTRPLTRVSHVGRRS